jgi:osmotically inducible protein OsmC
MSLKSTGRTHWDGDLFTGSGETNLDSGATPPMRVTWKARAEDHGGLTSPEELIAAAHASCYSMALSNTLAEAGTPPTSIDTQATATFVPGTGITAMELEVTAAVAGISEDDFLSAAQDAKENCPVSQALKGNVPISLVANLS